MARAEAKLKELRFESVVDYAPETQAECEVYFTYKREIKKKTPTSWSFVPSAAMATSTFEHGEDELFKLSKRVGDVRNSICSWLIFGSQRV